MNHRFTIRTRDLGQVLPGITYMRILKETKNVGGYEGSYLISSKDLFSKLTLVDRISKNDEKARNELDVLIRLPNSSEMDLKQGWTPTTIKRSLFQYFGIDGEFPYIGKNTILRYGVETVLATAEWMEEFDADPGDTVFISSQDPETAEPYIMW